ncbi:MAG: hypothetical protein L0Y35_04465 [Flammeovirgaceae bacterium]|nr:hypothetical protein [Flammeovirgaceae bacterium]
MKTYKLTLTIVLFAVSVALFGQDYAFKVMASKGTNEVKSGDAWQPLRTGTSLKSTDEVKLADNAYIGLIHATGKPVELREAGNYKVADLASKVSGGSSVLNKYTDFILSSNSAEAKKNRLSATGAVHRATDKYAISVMLPESQHASIYNNKATVTWDGSKVAGPYIVIVMDLSEEELIKNETPETTYTIELADAKLANVPALLVVVKSKADPNQTSKNYVVKRVKPEEKEKIKKLMEPMGTEVVEETALNKFILAGFYEENNLIIDAIGAYEEAVKLAPDVPTFREAYDEFLLRHNLKK